MGSVPTFPTFPTFLLHFSDKHIISRKRARYIYLFYYFLKALKDGKKTIAEIYDYIKPLVEDEAKQINVQQSPGINPEPEKLKGRFGLRR